MHDQRALATSESVVEISAKSKAEFALRNLPEVT
jgi:hypothetical protein